MFSSIEESQRIEVINKCYWPILDLVREYKITIGIEAKRDPQALLEFVNNIDQPIDSKNRRDIHFLKFNFATSRNEAIDKGKTILNQDPA